METSEQHPRHVLTAPPPPVPDSHRGNKWYATIRLPRAPVCPVCAEVLDQANLGTWRTILMCGPCATRARVADWPDPFTIQDVLDPDCVIFNLGLLWYSPRDLRPEPAIGRYIRKQHERGLIV